MVKKKWFILCFMLLIIPIVSAVWEVNIDPQSISSVNSSDYWDNLDVPTDIPNSEFWYNHTLVASSAGDTNATTACSGGEVLLGNGTCMSTSLFAGGASINNPFNQELNITSNVTFNKINTTSNITSGGWFNGLFNSTVTFVNNYIFGSFNGNELIIEYNETKLNETIEDKIRSIEYNATSINVVTGTYDSGNLDSILTADNSGYNISEDAGANPLSFVVNFSGVDSFNSIEIRYWYEPTSTHSLAIGLWDCSSSYEEEYPPALTETEGMYIYTLRDIIDSPSHVCDGENVSVRIRHTQAGNPAHDFSLDSMHLIKGASVSSPVEVDPLSHHKTQNIIATGYNLTIENITIGGDITIKGVGVCLTNGTNCVAGGGDFNKVDFQVAFDSNLSNVLIGNFSFIDFQPSFHSNFTSSFDSNLSNVLIGNFSFTDFQSAFNSNISGSSLGDGFNFTNFQNSFDSNLSNVLIGNFSFTDFQSSFNSNSTELGNFSFTDFQGAFDSNFSAESIADFSFTDFTPSFGLNFTEAFNTNFTAKSIGDGFNFTDFQSSFNNNISLIKFINSTIANNTYVNFTGIPTCTGSDVLTYDGLIFTCTTPSGGDFSKTDFQSAFNTNSTELGNFSFTDFTHSFGLNFTESFDSNITVLEYLSSTQLNESYGLTNVGNITFIENLTTWDCGGTGFVKSIANNGTVVCESPAGSGDFSKTDFQVAFDSNLSNILVGNFSFTDFQSSFDSNISGKDYGDFNFTDFQSSFTSNFTDLNLGDGFNFTDFQESFDSNISGKDYGDFNFTDFQSSFNLNFTDLSLGDGFNFTNFQDSFNSNFSDKSALLNLSYANLSRTITYANISDFPTCADVEEYWSFDGTTITCETDDTGGAGGNPFDQELNTTSNVTFDELIATGNFSADGTTLVVNRANDRVGIGTVSPTSELEIAGSNPLITLQNTVDSDKVTMGIGGGDTQARLMFDIYPSTVNEAQIEFFRLSSGATGNSEFLIYKPNTVTELFTFFAHNGRLGLNDSTPDFHQEIVSSMGSGYFGITDGATGTDGDIFIIDGSGKVGIGNSAPSDALEVSGNISLGTANNSALRLYENSAEIKAVAWGSTPTFDVDMVFSTATDPNSLTEQMRIKHDGKVGIGTKTPSDLLHLVGGNMNLSTNNITSTDCIIFTSGGKICSGI